MSFSDDLRARGNANRARATPPLNRAQAEAREARAEEERQEREAEEERKREAQAVADHALRSGQAQARSTPWGGPAA
jgi:hypothetical protein